MKKLTINRTDEMVSLPKWIVEGLFESLKADLGVECVDEFELIPPFDSDTDLDAALVAAFTQVLTSPNPDKTAGSRE